MIKDYLSSKRYMILLYVIVIFVFSITLRLYGLSFKLLAYPIILSAFICILFLAAGYIRILFLHKELCKIKNMTENIAANFPECKNIIEHDYQDVITKLIDNKNELSTSMDRKYQDMIDYYTVWAHQIKTPIASMRLNLQNEDSRLSRNLLSDLARTDQYVDMVLAFLRLGSDSTDYVLRSVDIDAVIKSTLRKFSNEFILRKLSLSYEPLNFNIISDEKWLSFVLEQLLSNALKYTPTGTISIYSPAKNTLCIEDTGIGIDESDLPRIFENGYTGYNGRIDKKASGIGLYLCKTICDRLGIQIKASSTPDKGTTITLVFNQYDERKE